MDPALTNLIAACTAFVGSHFAMSHPLRAGMVARLGQRGFLLVYSLVSFAALFWISRAFKAAPPGAPIGGTAGDALWLVASALTLVAMVLLAGSFRGNPALPDTPAQRVAAAVPRGVFRATRHPMMWAIAIWAVSHILLHWSARSMIVAAAMLILALVGSHLQDRKKAALMGDAWGHWAAQTSYWPRLGALFTAGWLVWLAGLALWLVASWAHIPAGGIPAGVWRWL